jgi:hypothetical protein
VAEKFDLTHRRLPTAWGLLAYRGGVKPSSPNFSRTEFSEVR